MLSSAGWFCKSMYVREYITNTCITKNYSKKLSYIILVKLKFKFSLGEKKKTVCHQCIIRIRK